MRQSKFTETQIVSMLKEGNAGRPVNEIWRNYGIRNGANFNYQRLLTQPSVISG
jgi:putative transposase